MKKKKTLFDKTLGRVITAADVVTFGGMSGIGAFVQAYDNTWGKHRTSGEHWFTKNTLMGKIDPDDEMGGGDYMADG